MWNGSLLDFGGLSLLSPQLNKTTVVVGMNISDKIELTMLSFYILFGSIVNLLVGCFLVKQYRHRTRVLKKNDIKSTFMWLKMALVAANLLVCSVLAPTRLGWLITYRSAVLKGYLIPQGHVGFRRLQRTFKIAFYRWAAGDIGCRLMHVLAVFALNMSSYLIVVIAIERANIVRGAVGLLQTQTMSGSYQSSTTATASSINKATKKIKVQRKKNDVTHIKLVRRMISTAFVASTSVSVVQLFTHRTYVPEFLLTGDSYCVSIFQYNFVQSHMHPEQSTSHRFVISFQVYSLFLLTSMFWAPFIIIVVSYCYVGLNMLDYVKNIHKRGSPATKTSAVGCPSPDNIQMRTIATHETAMLTSPVEAPNSFVHRCVSNPCVSNPMKFQHKLQTVREQRLTPYRNMNTFGSIQSLRKQFRLAQEQSSISPQNGKRRSPEPVRIAILHVEASSKEQHTPSVISHSSTVGSHLCLQDPRYHEHTLQVPLQKWSQDNTKSGSTNSMDDVTVQLMATRRCKSARSRQRLRRVRMRTILPAIAITVCYLVSYLPYNVLQLYAVVCEPELSQAEERYHFLKMIMFLNAVLSPLFYGFSN